MSAKIKNQKLLALASAIFALSLLMTGHVSAEDLADTPYPNLGNEIMLQGQAALSQLTLEQNMASNWQAKAATALTEQLADHEFEQMLAGTEPCGQKKNRAAATVKETRQAESVTNKPRKAQS